MSNLNAFAQILFVETWASLIFLFYDCALQVKWPGGKRYEDIFIRTLKKYGYKGSYMSKDWLKQPCFIQSFAPTSLVHVSNQTDLPKIFLIDDVTVLTQDTNQVNPIHDYPLYYY